MIVVRRVVGDSMLPTLRPGQIVVATRWVRLRPGKIVIALTPRREVVKRVKSVTARGMELIGDNPAASTDSRHFGPVDPRAIVGVVIYPRNKYNRS
jgi:nickel-type superoxide dismutase maturation protease